MIPKTVLQTQCPKCKRIGANTLVLSTSFFWRQEGTPVVECAGCHTFWPINEFVQAIFEFYAKVPLVQA